MYPPIPPTIQLGPLSIHWYGIIMVTAIFVGTWVASRYVTRKGQDGNRVWDMLLWVLIPALLGARLYFVFIQSPRGPNGLGHYLAYPLDILAVWKGGIHIYGAFILIIRVMEKQFAEFPEPEQHRGLRGSPTNGESALGRA